MSLELAISKLLASHPDGMSLDEVEAGLETAQPYPGPGVVEVILRLSDRFTAKTERWLRKTGGKYEQVAGALRKYAVDSARPIFRADNALRDLPDDQKPTADELASIVQDLPGFSLLKNNMIKVEE